MIKVTAAIIRHNGRFLIARRGGHDSLAGKWEFPGGKVEAGETPEACLKREIREELGIEIAVSGGYGESVHRYGDKVVNLLAYLATWEAGSIAATAHDAYAWVTAGELAGYDFAPADRPFVARLMREA